MILVGIFGVIVIVYGFVLTLAMIGWGRLTYFKSGRNHVCRTQVSVVIAAKNEATTIEACLKELSRQDYPAHLLEIIVVDDASEDETYEIIVAFASQARTNIRVIHQPEHAGKKRCLAAGVKAAKGTLIVTSDADTFGRSDHWLQTIVNYYENRQPRFIILPLGFGTGYSALAYFQILENIALTGITAGFAGIRKPFLCNGANLAFEKEAFEAVGGYDAHVDIASGEDVFLLEDIKKLYSAGSIHYLFSREAVAKTYLVKSVGALFHQRLRWAYKAKYNSNKINTFIGFIIVAANLLFPALIVGILQKSALIYYLSIFMAAKAVFDFLLLFLASDFLGIRYMLIFLLPFECIYWVYATVIGLSSMILKPTWKNRKIL
ncbi:MAG: glycosyltransferase [Bacteroidetes bacterium]|nr:glycosyltransferase [Bacteroidota bacterium]